ncbi:hypothetical protein [Streptomyces sp. NPDC005476]|uniref:tetratricopeptide repeat protein n=1 Tax=Streptomyces sp. NPDC005476 TaxID=3156882 RepID=UPI003455E683
MIPDSPSPNAPGWTGSLDPEQIETLSELKAGLNTLRGARSYAALVKALKPQPGLEGPRLTLAPSTITNLLTGNSIPRQETVVAFLTACGVGTRAQVPWLRAWERVESGDLRRPGNAVRVREARPLLLGVHPSIQVDDEQDTTDLLAYVPRDFDDGLRRAVTTASRHGGFVLLIGDSSVGKTRSLFEAVRTQLPEWWLIHPDAADATGLQALEAEQVRRTVVWLNELQDHLDGPVPLTAAITRRLIEAGLVLVGTLWSDEYTSRIAARVPGRPDLHADARQLLDLAHLVRVPTSFTPAERCRAEAFSEDRRIRLALDTSDVGLTQFLAAAPQLETWWAQAPNPYAKALITAALDTRRMGARVPLSPELLAAAVPGYLTPTEQARAGQHWLEEALEYATTLLHGAASTLRPTGTMGRTTGYMVADYLHQQANRARHAVPVPEAVWRAIVDHHHPRDTQPLAGSAHAWGEHRYAEALYRRAADRGDIYAGMQLGKLLLAAGRIEELRTRADAGDRGANSELVNLLAREGNLAELRTRSHAGDPVAARLFVAQLLQTGCVEEALSHLQRWADVGDAAAARYIRKVLAEQDRLQELSTLADDGDVDTSALAELLIKYGRLEELRTRADSGDRYAAYTLAEFLVQQGEVDELRSRADTGDSGAGSVLAGLLAGQGEVGEALAILRGFANAGDQDAACQLADLLAEHGDVDEATAILRPLTDSGFHGAWYRLANLLAEHGDVNGAMAVLLAQPYAGGSVLNASRVADVLAREGRLDDLRTLADAGNQPAASALAVLLAKLGHIDELRDRAGVAHSHAAWQYNALLARSGLLEELQARANAGDSAAAWHLSALARQSENVEDDASDHTETFLPLRRDLRSDHPSPP